MQILMLIEPMPGNRYRATAGCPFGLTAEGETRAEAIQKVRTLIDERFAAGAELVTMKVGLTEHPLATFAGKMDPDDPLVAEWEKAVQEYRQQRENDPDYP